MSKVNIRIDNHTNSPVTYKISDGTSIVAEGGIPATTSIPFVALTPGDFNGGIENGLDIIISPA